MATRGFEFVGMIDGSNAVPVVRDFLLGETTAYNQGDVVLMQSDGYADKVTGSTTEVLGVMQETITPTVAGASYGKVAIVTSSQIWKCSMDATTTSGVIGYTKTMDTADCNTIDADDVTNGRMALLDTGVDDDGNVLGYVTFRVPTFGNALS